jgi:hypothetical protein
LQLPGKDFDFVAAFVHLNAGAVQFPTSSALFANIGATGVNSLNENRPIPIAPSSKAARANAPMLGTNMEA